MKIKVIDLLNKIAKGEEVPGYIKYIKRKDSSEEIMYVCKENIVYRLDQLDIDLNDEVEIIEESQEHKIPGKIKIDNEDRIQALSTGNYCYKVKQIDKIIINKINEILDYLKEIK